MRVLACVVLFAAALPLLLAQQPPGDAGDPEPEVFPEEKGANDRTQLAIHTGAHSAPIRGAFLTQDGRRLVTVSEDRTGQTWDVASGERLQVLWLPAGNGYRGMPLQTAHSSDGRYLAYLTHNADDKGNSQRLIYVL